MDQEVEKFIQDSILKINDLIKRGEMSTAARGAKELYSYAPFDKRVKNLYMQIQGMESAESNKVIDERLAEVSKLMSERDYESALKLLQQLRRLDPTSEKVEKMIQKIEKKYFKSERRRWNEYIRESFAKISDLFDDEDWGNAAEALHELQDAIPESPRLIKMLNRSKILYIESTIHGPLAEKFKQNKEFDKLYVLYKKLYKIYPEYNKVKKLIKKTENKILRQRAHQKKAVVDKGVVRLKALYDRGEYQEVLKGVKELRSYTPENFELDYMHARADLANRKDTNKRYYKQMDESMMTLYRFVKRKLPGIVTL